MDADQKKINKDFKPVHIRETLDKRDGFTKLKRAKAYEALSQFGAHPTPSSFAMKKDGSGDITSGPLRNEELLIAMIEELAKVTLTLSTILNVYLSEVPGTGFYQSLLLIRAQKSQHFISMADEIAMSLGRVRSALRKPFLIQP